MRLVLENVASQRKILPFKDTKHRDFSLTDRAHDVQHSVEGTAMAGRCAQFKIHLP